MAVAKKAGRALYTNVEELNGLLHRRLRLYAQFDYQDRVPQLFDEVERAKSLGVAPNDRTTTLLGMACVTNLKANIPSRQKVLAEVNRIYRQRMEGDQVAARELLDECKRYTQVEMETVVTCASCLTCPVQTEDLIEKAHRAHPISESRKHSYGQMYTRLITLRLELDDLESLTRYTPTIVGSKIPMPIPVARAIVDACRLYSGDRPLDTVYKWAEEVCGLPRRELLPVQGWVEASGEGRRRDRELRFEEIFDEWLRDLEGRGGGPDPKGRTTAEQAEGEMFLDAALILYKDAPKGFLSVVNRLRSVGVPPDPKGSVRVLELLKENEVPEETIRDECARMKADGSYLAWFLYS